ncbi:MFS transporter [Sphingomonas bacterium]|uniref:MFS transporter n=1 Tax=Sphingomonas bacterium TaxID=1895847 RepID=UPI0015759616|nr:MFS transporter [Sphingomonas bacterium]
MHSPPHPFRIPNFRAYWIARLAMTLAQNGMIIVIGWQAYAIARRTMDQSHAATQLGLIGLCQFLPLFLTTPVTGLIADRFDRRHIVRVTVFLQLLCAAALGAATFADAMTLGIVFTIAVLLGLARAFAGPAFGALAPNLVPREVLPTAIALSSISWQTGGIVGPAIGGYAYSIAPTAAYAVAAGLFATALVAVLRITPVPLPASEARAHPVRQILDGLSYVGQNKLVLGSITLDLFAVFLAGTSALLPIYAADVLHVGERGLSLLAAAPAAGAAITAVVFSIRPMRTNVGPKMLWSVIVYGTTTIVFALASHVTTRFAMPLSLAALAIAGAADMFSVYIRSSLVQLHTPDAMRGRVGAVSQLAISASNELGEAESGFLASALGPIGAVLVGGGGAIAVTILWTFLFPALRRARTFDPPASLTDDGKALALETKP